MMGILWVGWLINGGMWGCQILGAVAAWNVGSSDEHVV